VEEVKDWGELMSGGHNKDDQTGISIPALYFSVLFSACTSQKSHKSQKVTSKTR
jgi:hypothetical protein